MRPRILAAGQCVITPCLCEYSTSTSGGSPNIPTTSTNYGTIEEHKFKPAYRRARIGDMQSISCWQSSPGELDFAERFDRPDFYMQNLIYKTSTSPPAFCPITDYIEPIATTLTDRAFVGDAISRTQLSGFCFWEYAFEYPNSQYASHYTSDNLRLIAVSNMSTVLGSLTASLTQNTLENSNDTIMGNVTISERYVRVKWERLVFPVALEVLGLVLLIATVVMIARDGAPL